MKVFLKAQISSFVGSVLDYSVMIILTELVGLYYVISTAIGAFVGAILNFSVNRTWVFRATQEPIHIQVPKFAFVAGMSIILNTYGTFVFTDLFFIDYKISRILIGLIVAIFWNFLLQKKFVFN